MMLTSVLDRPVRGDLAGRLKAVERLIDLADERIDEKLIDEARALLWRAGERLLLSGQHTIVALAGSTGSGKSSLFNTISGLELSPVGVRRPTTGDTHACVWGLEGVGPLLDWLSIEKRHRYARASALDRDEGSLRGLVLLDLPDHDSIKAAHRAEVDRLVEVVDLLVWVLDPQKYADTAIHENYLRNFARHAEVMVVVLNQIDRLGPDEAEECLDHLRELLRADGIAVPRIIATSTVDHTGIDELLTLLREHISGRQALADRLSADVDQLLDRLEHCCSVDVPTGLNAADRAGFVAELAAAAGGPALADAMEHAHVRRSRRYLDWPPLRLARRMRRDPLRRLGGVREELRDLPIDAVGAQEAEVENAVSRAASAAAVGLPEPWRASVHRAALDRVGGLLPALGSAMHEVVPQVLDVPVWWRTVRAFQWLLAAGVVAGLLWVGAYLALGVFEVAEVGHPLLVSPNLLPYQLALASGCAVLGILLMLSARPAAARGGRRRGELADAQIRTRAEAIAKRELFGPLEDELSRYTRFRDTFVAARGRR